jgi:hypothetical protein
MPFSPTTRIERPGLEPRWWKERQQGNDQRPNRWPTMLIQDMAVLEVLFGDMNNISLQKSGV